MAFVSVGAKSGRTAYKYAAMLVYEGFDVLVCVDKRGSRRFEIFVGDDCDVDRAKQIMAMSTSQRYLLTTK